MRFTWATAYAYNSYSVLTFETYLVHTSIQKYGNFVQITKRSFKKKGPDPQKVGNDAVRTALR